MGNLECLGPIKPHQPALRLGDAQQPQPEPPNHSQRRGSPPDARARAESLCLTSKEQAVEQALWLQLLRDSKSKSTGLSSCKLEYEDLLLNMLSAVSDPITPTHLACCGVSVQSYRS